LILFLLKGCTAGIGCNLALTEAEILFFGLSQKKDWSVWQEWLQKKLY
jgi:hypothetical protein